MKRFRKSDVIWPVLALVALVPAAAAGAGGNAADEAKVDQLIDEGVQLHDSGSFEAAIQKYDEALKIDKRSARALYEKAFSLYASKKYKEAIETADLAMKIDSKYLLDTIMVKGSALDDMGKPKEALETYMKALKDFPGSSLLCYNIGLSYQRLKEYKKVEEYVSKAVTLNPKHASSHLVMATALLDGGSPGKAALAFYHFLLLEPDGNRALQALDSFMKMLSLEGKAKSKAKAKSKSGLDKLCASTIAALKKSKESKGMSEPQLFARFTVEFFGGLGGLKKKDAGIWAEHYVPLFQGMAKAGHGEALAYYVSRSGGDSEVMVWLSGNQGKTSALLQWVKMNLQGPSKAANP